jgi:hypothetical protein
MASTNGTGAEDFGGVDGLLRDIAVQAELLALNFALEGEGAEQASTALSVLSRELRDAGRARPDATERVRSMWRLED